MRLLSATAQSIACPDSTYGYDVLVRIGWLRYQYRFTWICLAPRQGEPELLARPVPLL